jgi:hypothetical protein
MRVMPRPITRLTSATTGVVPDDGGVAQPDSAKRVGAGRSARTFNSVRAGNLAVRFTAQPPTLHIETTAGERMIDEMHAQHFKVVLHIVIEGRRMSGAVAWQDAGRRLTLTLAPGSRMLPPGTRDVEVLLAGQAAGKHVRFNGKPVEVRL